MAADETQAREEFARYTNRFGLIDNDESLRGGNSGNALLFHAHYVWTLNRRGWWSSEDRAITKGCVQKCQIEPGLFRRSQHGLGFSDDQEGPDDYVGLISMTGADPWFQFAQDFLRYGRGVKVAIGPALRLGGHPILATLLGWIRLRYVFNNRLPGTLLEPVRDSDQVKPNWSAWLGRFPAVIAHAEFAAGERVPLWRLAAAVAFWFATAVTWFFVSPWIVLLMVPAQVLVFAILIFGFRKLYWAASVWQAGRFSDGTDDWILTWHLVQTFRASGESHLICEWAARNFTERLFTKWPGGLSSVFLKYFGPDHPLTRYFLP
jgi:hypothetical protein